MNINIAEKKATAELDKQDFASNPKEENLGPGQAEGIADAKARPLGALAQQRKSGLRPEGTSRGTRYGFLPYISRQLDFVAGVVVFFSVRGVISLGKAHF